MRLSFVFTALVAAVSAAPIENSLFERAGTCAGLGTTTIAGKKATGPFKLTVTNAKSLEGNYAHAGAPDTLPFVIFGVKGNTARATEFYVDASGHLQILQNGKPYVAYESGPGENAGHVAISSNQNIASKITCKINKGACTLNCSVAGYNYNYLASPKYQPDWRIAGARGANYPTNVAFTVGVVTA